MKCRGKTSHKKKYDVMVKAEKVKTEKDFKYECECTWE